MKTIRTKSLIFFITCFLFFINYSIYAQDTIYTKDGREIAAFIIENDGANIKYKDANKSNGHIRNFDVNHIDFIKYADGTIERFVVTEKQTQYLPPVKMDPTLDFLNRKYERSLSTANIGAGMAGLGLLGLGVSLVGLLSGGPDGDIELWNTVTNVSGIIGITGAVIYRVGVYRANHYHNRIQQLSIIITPNHSFLAHDYLNQNMFNYGIRFTF